MIDILLYTRIIVELYVNFVIFFIIYKVNTNCHKLLTNFFMNIFFVIHAHLTSFMTTV